MKKLRNWIQPKCPKCGALIRLSHHQYVKCKACGVVLEDDRPYNMKLFFIFLAIAFVVASVVPLYISLPIIAVLVFGVVGNMRFIERREE